MRALLAWVRSHPKCAIAVAVLALFWGAHSVLAWAAERDWQQYSQEARARGVKLTFAEFEEGEVPEAQNFGALPMFKQATAPPGGPASHSFELPRTPSGDSAPRDDWAKRRFYDWVARQKLFKDAGLISEISEDPVADVLHGLDRYAASVAEWRQWRERPSCRFPTPSSDVFARTRVPWPLLHNAATFFGLRMRAHLVRGDTEDALVDFHDGFQAYRAMRGAPTLLNGIGRRAILSRIISDLGAALATQRWDDPELQALEATLANVCLENDYRFLSLPSVWS